jgi:REP element-mobilizing transposase RayT
VARSPRQLALPALRSAEKPRHGGRRRGAGRPRQSDGQTHVRRPRFDGRKEPVHVTVRFARHVWNLRSQRGFACVERALRFERGLGELRIVHFSVQGNHLHLIAEARDHRALARRMQGFGIRLARALNGMMGRKGRVYGDRYHARPLTSARQAFHAVRYVLQNHAQHAARAGRRAPVNDQFASSSLAAALAPRATRGPPAQVSLSLLGTKAHLVEVEALVVEPTTWFLRGGLHGVARDEAR